MPRKPTPTILDETPAGEETSPEAVLELTPEPELVKETVTQVVDEATGEMMEVTQAEVVETSPEGLRIEDINIVEVIENTASGIAGTVVETFEVQDIPVPAEDEVGKAASPLFKPMRSILLAGLGLASYAIEESIFVIGKLVERGELTQKEGAKLVAEMSKKAKMQLPSMPSIPGMPGRKHKEAQPRQKRRLTMWQTKKLSQRTPRMFGSRPSMCRKWKRPETKLLKKRKMKRLTA